MNHGLKDGGRPLIGSEVGVGDNRCGFTSIINLLELCAILSFNLNERQLIELWYYFQKRYQVVVLPAPDLQANLPAIPIGEIFDLIKNRTSFGDALMLAVAQRYLAFVSTMVTWDKGHFKHIFPGPVLTPEEFLITQKGAKK